MRRLLLVIFPIVVIFNCCKKSGDDRQNTFNFEFEGTRFKDLINAGIVTFAGEIDVVFIERPDLFGGRIYFHTNSSISNNCAYLYPTGEHILVHQPGCIIDNGGNSIDSVKFYFYRSGTITYAKTNCRRKKQQDPVSGVQVEYDVCDVKGSFNLTLGNKNNQTIVISNGSFSFYDLRF